MNLQHAEYLGDAVYAQWDGHYIWLSTGAHMGAPGVDNTIALEPSVLQALDSYRKRLAELLKPIEPA